MLYAIIGMLVIIADQWIKFWVAGHIIVNEEVQTIIPGILSLVNVHSGSGARIPFIILAGVFAVAVIIALATKLISGKLARWSIVLVTAGGLSNCLDRVIYGYVQDMFKFDFINFPVFNLADVFITVFAILFALAVIFGKTRKDDEEDDFFDEDEEEEEEEAPRVSRRKQRREKRRAAALEEEEEEDEEDEPAPVKKPRKLGRKARKAAEEEAEEPAAPAPAPKKAVKQEDPFADWDRANAKANAVKARRSEVVAAASKPAAKPAAPVQKQPAIQQPVRTNAQAAAAASKPAANAAPAKPAVPAAKPAAAPASRPAAKPAAKPVVEEEFSLDDILNEFK